MKEATFDPARECKMYFRCNRNGSKDFVLSYGDGTPYSFIYDEFQANIYKYEGERKVFIQLPITYNANRLTISITESLSNVNQGEYYFELFNVASGQTWIATMCIFHNGRFDGVTRNTESLTVNTQGEVINITIEASSSSTSGGGQVNTIQAGTNINVDDSDPVNPIVSVTNGVFDPSGSADDALAAALLADDAKFNKSNGVLTPVANPTYAAGKMVYNQSNDSLEWMNSESDVRLQIGQEHWIKVYNASGSTISNRTPVYINGVDGGTMLPTVLAAQANSETTMRAIGFATHDIETGTIGYVTSQGRINGVDTSAFAVGSVVYLSDSVAGGITGTIPVYPNWRVRMGIVVVQNATTGVILATQPTYVQDRFVFVTGTQDSINNNAIANTLQDATSYVVSLPGNVTYKFTCQWAYTSAATTTGTRGVLTPSVATTFYQIFEVLPLTLTSAQLQFGGTTGMPSGPSGNSPSAGGTLFMSGCIRLSAAGTVQLQFASEVAGSAITLLAGGFMHFEAVS